ncbi:hypothetical protein AtNW77_Chr2g0263641 [Arabidopsis thaliana]|uniref:Uncharacterized protein n=1 Tax=Arabidopsis suecica TaxID=45249 RepID=A0A8T2G9A1_ARASU|nr:hypothetical protein ISN44_As02g036800 [Arabidopsis suecica]
MCILSCRKLLKKGKKYHSCMWNRFALSQYYRNLNFQHDILNRAYKSLMFLLVVLIDQGPRLHSREKWKQRLKKMVMWSDSLNKGGITNKYK